MDEGMIGSGMTEGEVTEGEIRTENPWGQQNEAQTTVVVETGRGSSVRAAVGAPFAETIERIADQANYGGYFRVYLNGGEIVDPTNAPPRIEAGMRIAITAYDKVGQ